MCLCCLAYPHITFRSFRRHRLPTICAIAPYRVSSLLFPSSTLAWCSCVILSRWTGVLFPALLPAHSLVANQAQGATGQDQGGSREGARRGQEGQMKSWMKDREHFDVTAGIRKVEKSARGFVSRGLSSSVTNIHACHYHTCVVSSLVFTLAIFSLLNHFNCSHTHIQTFVYQNSNEKGNVSLRFTYQLGLTNLKSCRANLFHVLVCLGLNLWMHSIAQLWSVPENMVL